MTPLFCSEWILLCHCCYTGKDNPLSLLPPIGQCLLQPLLCALALAQHRPPMDWVNEALFHYRVWDRVGVFYYSFMVCWGWGVGNSVRRVCTSAPSIPSWPWMLILADSLTEWTNNVCTHVGLHYSSTCCVTLDVLSGWPCVVWKERVCLQLYETECTAGCCVCGQSHSPEPKIRTVSQTLPRHSVLSTATFNISDKEITV